ncbi:hypothetical protein ACS0TY_004771 [Phlomoides rotata]
MKREKKKKAEIGVVEEGDDGESESLPNPVQAVATSALAFSIGVMVSLQAASFIGEYKLRIWSIVEAVSGALVAFGGLGAALGRAPVVRLTVRVVVAEKKLNSTEFFGFGNEQEDLGTNMHPSRRVPAREVSETENDVVSHFPATIGYELDKKGSYGTEMK